MKISIFIGSLSGGGSERVVCNLSNYLSKIHEVTIITMSNDTASYELNEAVKRVCLEDNCEDIYIIKNLKRITKLKKTLKNSDEDIYIVFLRVTSFLLLYFKKMLNAPIIVSERADPTVYFNGSFLRTFLMKILYPKADGFVFQTESAKKYYEGIINNNSIIIPNAINEEFIRESYKGKRKKKIVSAGRFTDQKNFKLLIEAFSIIEKKFPEYELIVYGDGPQREELESYINELGINKKVKLPGYFTNLGDYIIDASLFVLSSNFEGMPNTLMEAMALGLPCIATDCPVGGPDFLIKNNHNGLLVPIKNVGKLVDAIDYMLSNEMKSLEMGNIAKEISNTLSSDNIYKEWDLYIRNFFDNKK